MATTMNQKMVGRNKLQSGSADVRIVGCRGRRADVFFSCVFGGTTPEKKFEMRLSVDDVCLGMYAYVCVSVCAKYKRAAGVANDNDVVLCLRWQLSNQIIDFFCSTSNTHTNMLCGREKEDSVDEYKKLTNAYTGKTLWYLVLFLFGYITIVVFWMAAVCLNMHFRSQDYLEQRAIQKTFAFQLWTMV